MNLPVGLSLNLDPCSQTGRLSLLSYLFASAVGNIAMSLLFSKLQKLLEAFFPSSALLVVNLLLDLGFGSLGGDGEK